MPRRLIGLGFAVAIAPLACGDVNVPPGYYLVEINEPGTYNSQVRINNLGQFVWARGYDPFDGNTYEIMMYDQGEVIRVTDDGVRDRVPDINDQGTIVWSRTRTPGGALDIAMDRGNGIEFLTDEAAQADPHNNEGPSINSAGHVVWARFEGGECSPTDGDLWFFDGASALRITHFGLSNQAPKINSSSEIAWTRYNDCDSPWTSQVWFRDRSGATAISVGYREAQGADIADDGSVVWGFHVSTEFEYSIALWRDGSVDIVSEWGYSPTCSDDGSYISWDRWFDSSQTWQPVICHHGHEYQLTEDEYWNVDAVVNNRGEAAWYYGPYPYYQVRAIVRYSDGDMNCDHEIGVGDIAGFVLAIVDSGEYAQQYQQCDYGLGDLNHDGAVSVGDIGLFAQKILVGR